MVSALTIKGETILFEDFDKNVVGNGLDGRHEIRGSW
jgi:hypothetical protein